MQNINGNLIYQVKRFLIEKFGKEVLTDLLEQSSIIDHDTKEFILGTIMSNQWYPDIHYQKLLKFIDEDISREILVEASEFAADKQSTAFFGFVVSMAKLDVVTKRLDLMWQKMWDSGVCKITDSGVEGRIIFSVTGFEKMHDSCMLSIEHYFRIIFDKASGKHFVSGSKEIIGGMEFTYEAPG